MEVGEIPDSGLSGLLRLAPALEQEHGGREAAIRNDVNKHLTPPYVVDATASMLMHRQFRDTACMAEVPK